MCHYWLRADDVDRSAEDCDGHVCYFAGVLNSSSGEDLENIIYWLAPNDDFGYMVPIIAIVVEILLMMFVFYFLVEGPEQHFQSKSTLSYNIMPCMIQELHEL